MRIVLVNMPFADWHRPSVELSLLAAHTKREYGDSVDIEIRDVNVDFALIFGPGDYQELANNVGIGEWFFRQVAFPDNPDEYFQRYFADDASVDFRVRMLQIRDQLADFCDSVIDDYELADADIVGFTSTSLQTIPSMALARLLKERNPEVITVMSGSAAVLERAVRRVLAGKPELAQS